MSLTMSPSLYQFYEEKKYEFKERLELLSEAKLINSH